MRVAFIYLVGSVDAVKLSATARDIIPQIIEPNEHEELEEYQRRRFVLEEFLAAEQRYTHGNTYITNQSQSSKL